MSIQFFGFMHDYVTIHSHFTHMRKNSRQSRLPMLHILIFCLCGWSDWFQSDKNCQSASY